MTAVKNYPYSMAAGIFFQLEGIIQSNLKNIATYCMSGQNKKYILYPFKIYGHTVMAVDLLEQQLFEHSLSDFAKRASSVISPV